MVEEIPINKEVAQKKTKLRKILIKLFTIENGLIIRILYVAELLQRKLF